ncbi:hypothetical protein [Streptomyces sp. NPDC005548]|uniref:hypothetical protein n=1 Tax=Streptomyces sp. NPDC005548 TaxID=3364724 RepID=UPI0036782D48
MAGLDGEGTARAAVPSDAMDDAVDSIGTTLDERTTCEELAASWSTRSLESSTPGTEDEVAVLAARIRPRRPPATGHRPPA